jgi:pimeloyl-ACP methyl ester carboxylesterase
MRSLVVDGGGGVQLHVEVCGPREPRATVVLVHGFSMSARVWGHHDGDGCTQGLLRQVAWDLRGHGRSGRPTDPDAYRDPGLWAEDLDAVVRATSDSTPVVLVAWSYGARVVGDYLARYGDGQLAGVVFVGARVRDDGPPSADPARGLAIKAGMLSPRRDEADAATGQFVQACFTTPPDPAVEELVVHEARLTPWRVRRAMDGRPITAHEVAGAVTVPTLVVHGEHDAMFDLRSAHTTAELFDAELVVYPGCGHALFLEQPEWFARDLESFALECAAQR